MPFSKNIMNFSISSRLLEIQRIRESGVKKDEFDDLALSVWRNQYV